MDVWVCLVVLDVVFLGVWVLVGVVYVGFEWV